MSLKMKYIDRNGENIKTNDDLEIFNGIYFLFELNFIGKKELLYLLI